MNESKTLQQIRDGARKKNDEQYKTSSKKRLMTNIERKFNTSMIGSLATFEKYFGHLWGQGVDPNQLTAQELEWLEKWEMARTELLNNSNNQKRTCLDEIAQYTLTWNRYQTQFLVRKED